MSTGTSNLAEAKKIAIQVEAKLTNKELEIPLGGSFSSFVKKYLEFSKLNKAYATYEQEKGVLSSLSKFLKDGDTISIDKITHETIEKYKKYLIDDDRKTATCNKHLRTLSSCFREAVRWGLIKKNPVMGVRRLREVDTVVRFLTKEEIKKLMEALSVAPEFKKLVEFYLLTGFRRNEALFLDWEDFKKDYIQIRNKPDFVTKTGQNRKFPRSKKIKKLISTLDTSKERPFPYRPDWVSRRFSYYAGKAGLTNGVDLHCLRHTFASHLVMAGVDLVTVSKLLGHSSIQTTMIYAHLIPEHMAAAVEKVNYL